MVFGVPGAVLVTAYMAAVTVIDLRTKEIPNWLTMPPMLVLGIYRILERDFAFLVFWVTIYLLWRANIWGAADAKVLMSLFALWPTASFLMVEALGVIVAGSLALMARCIGRPLGATLRGAWHGFLVRLGTGQLLPTEEELAEAPPGIGVYALGAVAYGWLVCVGAGPGTIGP